MNKIRIATNEKALTVRLLARVCDTFCTVSMDDKVCRGCAVNTLVRLIDI